MSATTSLRMTSMDDICTTGFKKDKEDDKAKALDTAIKRLYLQTRQEFNSANEDGWKLRNINLSRRVLIIHNGKERKELCLHKLSLSPSPVQKLAVDTLRATKEIFSTHGDIIAQKNHIKTVQERVYYGGKTTAENSVIASFNTSRSWFENGINEDIRPLYSGQVRQDLRHCQALLLGEEAASITEAQEVSAEKAVTKQLVKVEAFFYERNYQLAVLADKLKTSKSELEQEITAKKREGAKTESLREQLVKIEGRIATINGQKESNGRQYDRFAIRQYLVYSYICRVRRKEPSADEFVKFATESYKRLAPKADVTVGLTKDYLSQLSEYVKPTLLGDRTFGMSLEIGMAKAFSSFAPVEEAEIEMPLYLFDGDGDLDSCARSALGTATDCVKQSFPEDEEIGIAAFRERVKDVTKPTSTDYKGVVRLQAPTRLDVDTGRELSEVV